MNISDKNITTLLESRNEQALKLLSEKYGGLCSSISYNVLGNRSDSEEVTNDTYMKVWNTIPPEKPRSLCAYVAKIVRNLSLDKLRYNANHRRWPVASKRGAFESLYRILWRTRRSARSTRS